MTSPVLFLIFNRPEVAAQSFACIRRARPPRLYIAADGPRADRPEEEDLCMQTRRIVDTVDWPCSVKTLFRKHNLGCAKGVSTAISWFFQHEEEGIILEDDIVTHPDFFSFCEAMLERYRHDERIMHISGINMQFGIKRGDASYYFSEIMHCWGWASWRYAWKRFDYSMYGLSGFIKNDLPKKFTSPAVVAHFQTILRYVRNNTIDSWATRWLYSIWQAGGLCLQSNVNMIKNIGFSASATHTTGMSLRTFLVPCPMGEIVHTENVVRNEEADALTCRIEFSGVPESFAVYFNEVLLRMETKQFAEALFLLAMMKQCYGDIPILRRAVNAVKALPVCNEKHLRSKQSEDMQNKQRYPFFEKPIIGISVEDIPHKKYLIFPSESFIMPKYKDIFGSVYENIYEVNTKIPDMYVHEFNNAFCFTHREEIFTENCEVILEQTSQKINPLLNTILKKTEIVKFNKSIADFSLSGLEDNYGHHLIEYLSRYWLLKESGIKPDYYIMTRKEKFQQQWIDLLDIDVNRIIPSNIHMLVQAEKLIVPNLTNNWEPIRHRGYPGYAKQWIPSWLVTCYQEKFLPDFLRKINLQTGKYAKRIYISRRAAKYRKLLNEDELIPILKKNKFIICIPENLEIKDQLMLFAEAEIVVGIQGAGFANIIFSNKNTKVMEIFSQYFLDSFTRILATALGIHYTYIVGSSINMPTVHPQKENFVISPEKFAQALDMLLYA
jgi:hypothetical protein